MMNHQKTGLTPYFFIVVLLILSIPCAALAAGDVGQAKVTAIQWVDENAARISQNSYRLWEYAEIGLKEFKSSDLLVGELEANGFKVERGLAGMPTSFVGTYTRGTGKPVIGILAEYDALPNGHSCGHNLFGAGSVAAAVALKTSMEKHAIDGTIKLFGTPTEDTHGGKVWMAREGIFKGCDALLDWHPHTKNVAQYGSNLAVQILELNYKGKSSHAGVAPEKGRSALDGLMVTSMALEYLREHMIEPMRIQYIITNGGQAPNIVPETAQMKLVIRGPTMKDITYLRTREGGVDDCARAGALGTGTDVTMQVVGAFYNLMSNKAGAYFMYENMKVIPPPAFMEEEEKFVESVSKKYNTPLGKLNSKLYEPEAELSKGSADTGDVSYLAPLIQLRVACAAKDSPGHSLINKEQYGMSIGWKGTVYAAKILAATALDLLTDQAKLTAVTTEFNERIKGAEYSPVIPADLWPPIPDKNPQDFKGPAPKVSSKPREPESLLFWKKK